MESILLDLHIAVGVTVLLTIVFLLNFLYSRRRLGWLHLFWRTVGIGMLVLLVALVSLPEITASAQVAPSDPGASQDSSVATDPAISRLSNLTTAMEMGDADRVRQLTKEGRWHIIEGDSADLFDGETLKGWWALSDQWTVQDGQIVCPTSERVHFAISEIVIDEPFQLRYEVSALERSHGDGKMVGFVDAAGYNMLVALDDDEPHTIQIDSGRKFFDESGIYGPWQREVAADLQMQIGKWYDVVCTVDGSNFTVSTGDVELSHPFEPEFPIFIWLEVQRTGAKYRGLRISKL